MREALELDDLRVLPDIGSAEDVLERHSYLLDVIAIDRWNEIRFYRHHSLDTTQAIKLVFGRYCGEACFPNGDMKTSRDQKVFMR
jgi:hypothetical protein